MTAALLSGAYRQFMSARGVDASSSPQAIRAALNEFSASLAATQRARPRVGLYNSKTLPLGDPYVAAENYNVTLDNVARQWGRVWLDRANEDGGSRTIFRKVEQLSRPQAILDRGGSPNDLQWQLVDKAVRTGVVDPRLKPATLLRLMGTGLSETARHQQHKPKGILSMLVDPIVQFGLGAINPGLAVAYGAVRGGMRGGPIRAITGGAKAFAGNVVGKAVGP